MSISACSFFDAFNKIPSLFIFNVAVPRIIKTQATMMVNFAEVTKIVAEKEASPLPSRVATSAAAAAAAKCSSIGDTGQEDCCDNVIERHDDDDADAIHDDHTHSVRFVKTVDVHVHNEVLGFNPSTKVGRQALHYTTRATTNVCASGCEKQLVLELAVNTSNLALPS